MDGEKFDKLRALQDAINERTDEAVRAQAAVEGELKPYVDTYWPIYGPLRFVFRFADSACEDCDLAAGMLIRACEAVRRTPRTNVDGHRLAAEMAVAVRDILVGCPDRCVFNKPDSALIIDEPAWQTE
jgi:hypothetical protein